MKTVLLAALLAVTGYSQTPAAFPQDFVAAGAGWNQYATPQVNGWASYGRLLSQSQGIYLFTTYDVTSAKTHPFTVQPSIRPGAAMHIKDLGPVRIFALGDGGIAAAGSNVGSAFSAGGFAEIPFRRSGIALLLGARRLKTSIADPNQKSQTVYEVGFGWGFR